jgi:hypothetical protein
VPTHPDPRWRRRRPLVPPIDAVAAAVRLEMGLDELRAGQLERGPADDDVVRPLPAPPPPPQRADDDPPTGLIDMAAVRAMLAGSGTPPVPANPASLRWLRNEPEPDPVVQWLPELAAPEPDHCSCPMNADTHEMGRSPSCPLHGYTDDTPATAAPAPELFDCLVLRNGVHREPCGPQHVSVPLPSLPPVPPPAPVTPRLTWASRHDPRSLDYGVRERLLGSAPLTDRQWSVGPVLDQGAEGACVGCGVVDATNVLRLLDPLVPVTPATAMLTLPDALELYRRAQQLDDVPGESYTGTSVLAGMQAGVERGLFDHYLWAFGTKDIAQAVLQVGPVIIGIPWLSGMYTTGPGGLVQVTGDNPDGAGHCLAVVGIRMRGPQGQPGPFFVWQNSWGTGYGDGGLGYIHHRDLAQLLHGTGEAAVPVAGRS